MKYLLLSALILTPISASADVWTFETPSKNVHCWVGQEPGFSDISCTIFDRKGSPALPRPADCLEDWGHTFEMSDRGQVRVLCEPLRGGRHAEQQAPYGVTGRFGGFVCSSTKKGFECRNRDNNGFFLSRKTQKVFNGASTSAVTSAWTVDRRWKRSSRNGFRTASVRAPGLFLAINCPVRQNRSNPTSISLAVGQDDFEGLANFTIDGGRAHEFRFAGGVTAANMAFQADVFSDFIADMRNGNSVVIETDKKESITVGLRGSGKAIGRCPVRARGAVAETQPAPERTTKAEGYEEELRLRRQHKEALLKAAGYNPGPIDGTFDAQSIAALHAFQKDNGFKLSNHMPFAQSEFLEQRIIEIAEAARRRPVTESPAQAQASVGAKHENNLQFNTIYGGVDFVTINGHAVMVEKPSIPEPLANYWAPWTLWLSEQLPLNVPALLDSDLRGRLMLAHYLLSNEQKTQLTRTADLGTDLFFDKNFPVTVNTKSSARNKALAYQLRESMRKIQGAVNRVVTRELDEFSKPVASRLVDRYLAENLANRAKKLPLPAVQLYEIYLGEYDHDKQAFHIKSIHGNGGASVSSPSSSGIARALAGAVPFATRKASLTSDVDEFPNLLPMRARNAKAFLARLKQERGDKHRVLTFAVFGAITHLSGEQVDGELRGLSAHFEADHFEYWIDSLGEQVVHRSVPNKQTEEVLQNVVAEAADRREQLFGQEYLVHSLSPLFPDMLKNETFVDWLYKRRLVIEHPDAQNHHLPDGVIEPVIRPEVLSGERAAVGKDRAAYLAFLKGRGQAGASKIVFFPLTARLATEFALNPTDPRKFLEQTLTASTGDQPFSIYYSTGGKILVRELSQGRLQTYRVGTVPIDKRHDARVAVFLTFEKSDLAALPELRSDRPFRNPVPKTSPWVGGPFSARVPEGSLPGYLMVELSPPERIDLPDQAHRKAQQAVMFKAKPMKLVVFDGEKMREFALSAGASSSRPKQVVKKPTGEDLVADPQTNALPFNAMMADLLLVRTFGSALGDDDYKRMAMARWHYENSLQQPGAKPMGGRFFEFGQPKPSGSEIVRLASEYREWAMSLAAQMPNRFSFSNVHLPMHTIGPVHFGGRILDGMQQDNVVRSCGTTLQGHINQGKLRQDQLDSHRNICTYLQQAATYSRDYAIYGEPDYLDLSYRKRQAGGSSFLKRYSVHGTVGFRGACQKLSRRDAYCIGMHNALQSPEFASSAFVLDDVYIMDKIVQNSAVIQANVKAANDKVRSLNTRLIFEVGDIELQEKLQDPYFKSSAIKAHEAMIEQGFLQKNRAANWSQINANPPSAYRFELRVKAVEMYDRKSGRTLYSVPLSDIGPEPDIDLLKALEMKLVQPPLEASGPDIVGLRLGMSFEEADKVIRAHMDVGTVKHADRKWNVDIAFGELQPFSSGRLYESKDGKETIVLVDEAPSATGTVLGVTRTLILDKDKIAPASLARSLRKKYGDPVKSDNGYLFWGEDNNNCLVGFEWSSNKGGIWRNEDGSQDDWSYHKFGNNGVPVPDQTERWRLETQKGCDLRLVAHLNTRHNSEWDRLYQSLFNKSVYLEQFRQSEALIKKGVGLGVEGDEVDGDLGVKL